jgi:uncharacterized protein YjdB
VQIVSFPRPRWSGRAAALLMLALAAGCDDDPTDARKPVAVVEVSPAALVLPAGESRPLAAAPRTADGRPLAGRPVAWASEDESIATVDAAGRVTAVAEGTVVITATSEGRTGRSTITIPRQAVARVVIPGDSVQALLQGASLQLVAIPRADNGADLNMRNVSWTSSDPLVAWVSPSGGVVARRWGDAVVTAEIEGVSAQVTIRVLSDVRRLELDPKYLHVAVGEVARITATPKTDGGHVPNKTVLWASEDESIATVVNGRVTGLSAGTTTITATVEGITAQSQVTVSAWDEYRLESVDGKPLPVTTLEGSFQDESGATHAYRWELTEGLLRMLPLSRYERRFTFRIHAGGSPPRTETLVEHGALFYHMLTGELIFDSDDRDVPDGRGTLSPEGVLSMKQRGSEAEPESTYLFRRR